MFTKIASGAVVVISLVALVGCSAQTVQPTASCKAAFDTASAGIDKLYSDHPFYSAQKDALYDKGEVSDSDQEKINAWFEDSEKQFNELLKPTYQACKGSEDFYAGAFSQGSKGKWNLQGNKDVSVSELKENFLVAFCHGHEKETACSDFDPEK